MSEGPSDFDLSAAWLRKAHGDLGAFLAAFATRMEGAMPGRIGIERRRDWLLSKQTHVVKVAVEAENCVYTLALERNNLRARRAKVVRGVTLKSEEMAVPEWLAALNQEIQRMAAEAGAARNVIHDFLLS